MGRRRRRRRTRRRSSIAVIDDDGQSCIPAGDLVGARALGVWILGGMADECTHGKSVSAQRWLNGTSSPSSVPRTKRGREGKGCVLGPPCAWHSCSLTGDLRHIWAVG